MLTFIQVNSSRLSRGKGSNKVDANLDPRDHGVTYKRRLLGHWMLLQAGNARVEAETVGCGKLVTEPVEESNPCKVVGRLDHNTERIKRSR